MLRIHHPVFGRYYRISWNGIYHIPYRYIMIITEYNILWNIVTIYILWNIKYIYIFIYFPLFGVPTLAHKHIMDQRSGVAFGVPRLTRLLRLRKGDKTLDNSSRGCWFHTCCQGISWDAICSYLFIFAKQHSLEFMIYYMYDMYFFDAYWSCGRCSHCFVLIQCYLPVKPVSAGMCWLGASWGWNQSWLLPGLPVWVSNHGY